MSAKSLIESLTAEDTPSKLVISKEQQHDAEVLLRKQGLLVGFMGVGNGEVNVLLSKSDIIQAEQTFKMAGIEYYRYE